MNTRSLTPVRAIFLPAAFLISLATGPQLRAADAVFGSDGNRVWINPHQQGTLAYLDTNGGDGAAEADRIIDVGRAGGPLQIQGLAVSKSGNVLMASLDAVWAFNPVNGNVVRVAKLPAGFEASDLAYENASGAILVWGAFIQSDRTVLRSAAYRIARQTNRPVPVLIDGIGSWESAAFDDAGHLFLGTGPDLWGGVLVPTESGDSAQEFPWQLHAFRIAAIGTPVNGEDRDAMQVIHAIAAGGSSLLITMRGPEGSTMVRVAPPALSTTATGVDRVTGLADRWAMQRKVIDSAQIIGKANSLPLLPIVALSEDGHHVVYQTAATGIRRWWRADKSSAPKMLVEESD